MVEGTYYIETYGCQMNEHDSEKMSALLERMGLTAVSSPERAEVIVINTCSIREKAEHKVYSALGKLKPLKAKNPRMVTIVSGCVAQQEKEGLLKKAGYLDAVLGTHCIDELPELVEQIKKTGERIARTAFSKDVKSLHVTAHGRGRSPVCSYVTIMQGCSNFCSYCVVPFTRGPEQSRPFQEILDEVSALTQKGIREITLLGQNVNAYGNSHDMHISFAHLLEKLHKVQGLNRIRFTTSHPRDFHEDLISAIADLDSVCEHVHLPLQAGSDRILKAMRRGYTLDYYLGKVAKLRSRIPKIAITSDIIVGFPGETEDDFLQTFEALQQIRFDQIFSFKYSPRPGTGASSLPGQVPEEAKTSRLAEVQTLQDQITQHYHKLAEGTEEEVLIEGIRIKTGQPFGRTRTNKIVNLESSQDISAGETVKAKIIRGLKHSMIGRKIS